VLAREFAREGCRLVLAARDAQGLARAQQDLRQRGAEVLAVSCDVTDQEQVRSLVDQATQRFGCVDIVVNNAGIIQVGPMSTTTTEDFANALDVMFLGDALSHAGGAAPDAGAAQWACSQYYLYWRRGECSPPVTIYMC
jgi:NAD(P)-dependent dehydrogenase (short-subunit alcohol dehydrogenase family)